MTSYLPTLILVRADLSTVLNQIDAYEVACQRLEWTGADVAKKQASAVHTIQRRLLQAYNRLDLGPTEREKLAAENRQMRDELNALRYINARLTDTNERLTADNVRRLEGKTP